MIEFGANPFVFSAKQFCKKNLCSVLTTGNEVHIKLVCLLISEQESLVFEN